MAAEMLTAGKRNTDRGQSVSQSMRFASATAATNTIVEVRLVLMGLANAGASRHGTTLISLMAFEVAI